MEASPAGGGLSLSCRWEKTRTKPRRHPSGARRGGRGVFGRRRGAGALRGGSRAETGESVRGGEEKDGRGKRECSGICEVDERRISGCGDREGDGG